MESWIDQLPGTFPFGEVATKLAVALGAGLLVGLEREWAQKEVGVRTFSITALLGALAALLSQQLLIGTLAGVLLLVVFMNVHSLLKDRSLEMTTSISLMAALVLGAMAGAGHYFTTATATVLITMLLAWKVELSRFVDALKPEEIRGAVLLGLLSFVIYPLLPDRFIDPWQVVNPRQAWVTVVVIAGIGFVNYGLLRAYGARGLYYGAVMGGLVNSTATVTELSGVFAGRPALAARAAGVLQLANLAMFARNGVILVIFAPVTFWSATPPLAVMAGASALMAWVYRAREDGAEGRINLGSPVSLLRVLKFGVIFLLISASGTMAQRHFGGLGFLVVALLGGLVSSASTTASAAELLAVGQISASTAVQAAVLTSIASALVNIPLVYQQTRQGRLTLRLAALTGVTVALGVGCLVGQWWWARHHAALHK